MWASMVPRPTVTDVIEVFYKPILSALQLVGKEDMEMQGGAAVRTAMAGVECCFLERASACLTTTRRVTIFRYQRERLKHRFQSAKGGNEDGMNVAGNDVGGERTVIARPLRLVTAIGSKVSESRRRVRATRTHQTLFPFAPRTSSTTGGKTGHSHRHARAPIHAQENGRGSPEERVDGRVGLWPAWRRTCDGEPICAKTRRQREVDANLQSR
jgi:hypothetical protein